MRYLPTKPTREHVLLIPLTLTLLAPFTSSSTLSPRQSSTFNATSLDPGFPISNIITLATSLPAYSWEFGTAVTALIDLYTPNASAFTAPSLSPAPSLSVASAPALQFARQHISLAGLGGINGLTQSDGAVGDPASLGIGAILLGAGDWSNVEGISDGGTEMKGKYWDAAGAQLEYLLTGAPRYPNGAISQRVEGPELWADFMSMVPPFLAYFAVATNNGSLLQESVRQCALYRDVLQPVPEDGSERGLWRHIVGPYSPDAGLWSTGNAWAAAGMARVLGTVMRAPSGMFNGVASSSTDSVERRRRGSNLARRDTLLSEDGYLMKHIKSWWKRMPQGSRSGGKRRRQVVDEVEDLVGGVVELTTDEDDGGYSAWLSNSSGAQFRTRTQIISFLTSFIQEILSSIVDSASLDNGLVRNYVDDVSNTDGRGFGEVSGSALLASVMYRMAVLAPGTFGEKYVEWADNLRYTLGRWSGGGYVHVTSNGTVTPTVNPYGWGDTQPWTRGSPEGQAFVVLMYAAWRDCVSAGVCGAD
ncbi:hypothetical protein FA13DRAFT_1732979 [Coprinellus micaceus]|uniref:Six-hairpin glycosidase n=1 Tax=Coprinellus micaceus TaxID=71717 RepID=A0A4Y7TA73_COPMI|nr:hypothetical protein FA13DRAFT_1732979 [Coprinellus micaceus]